jgi:hypothetical protein
MKTFSFPSVYEATIREYFTSNDPVLGFAKIKIDGTDYIVGLQAFNEGVSPHKSINASPFDTDYKVISQSALFLASKICINNSKNSKPSKFALTVGFPFATFQINQNSAEEYYKTEKLITYYKADENGHITTEQRLIPVVSVSVIPEVLGCDIAIRNGENPINGNFIVISLGYGTCEGAVSTPEGLVSRSIFSTHGISYAVNIFSQELQKNSYLNLRTEHQIDQVFTKGFTYVDRKKKEFESEKKKALQLYYSNVISPTINKFIKDQDFETCRNIVLVGGGGYLQDLVSLFKEEFGEICTVSVAENPERCASIGYAHHAKQALKINNNPDKDELTYQVENEHTAYVGIDIGNANTNVSLLCDY